MTRLIDHNKRNVQEWYSKELYFQQDILTVSFNKIF